MFGYIYITTNKINNKKYIGKKNGQYNPNYLGSGKYLQNAVNKYGKENFTNKILCLCDTENELNEKEKYYIKKYNAVYSKEFYNIHEGGSGGNAISGYTEEDYEKFRQTMSKVTKGEKNGMYGKKHTIETKQLISKNRDNSYLHTEKFRQTMSKVTKGEKNGMYGRKGENSVNGKSIKMIDDNGNVIKEFKTRKLALEYLKLNYHSTFYKAIKNKTKFKGYYWKE